MGYPLQCSFRVKYLDAELLAIELDKIYGYNQFELKVRWRFHLMLVTGVA